MYTSHYQKSYLSYIENNPGCSIADVVRACKVNPRAGHCYIYDGVNRLVKRGMIKKTWKNGKTSLTITESVVN